MSQPLHDHKAATGAVTGPEFDDGYLHGWEDREARLPTRDELREEVLEHSLAYTALSSNTCSCGERIGHTDPDGNDWMIHLIDTAWHRVVDADLDPAPADYEVVDMNDQGWRIAAVLREHRRIPDHHGRPLACRCGFATRIPGATFEAHLANAIQREALA